MAFQALQRAGGVVRAGAYGEPFHPGAAGDEPAGGPDTAPLSPRERGSRVAPRQQPSLGYSGGLFY